MIAAYLLGVPGVGKSAVMEHYLATTYRRFIPINAGSFRYRDFGNGVVALGSTHPVFPGSDTLHYAVFDDAESWLATTPASVILGEGERLTATRFLTKLAATTDRLDLILLTAPPEVVAARRAARGVNHPASWLAGKETQHARVLDRWAPYVSSVDAAGSLASVCATLTRHYPAFRYPDAGPEPL